MASQVDKATARNDVYELVRLARVYFDMEKEGYGGYVNQVEGT
jgi:hypothetical protein